MVFEFGMSEVALADDAGRQLRALRRRSGCGTRQARLTDHAYEEANASWRSTDQRSTVAQALLEKETLDRSELEALLADVPPESHSAETIGTVRAHFQCVISLRG